VVIEEKRNKKDNEGNTISGDFNHNNMLILEFFLFFYFFPLQILTEFMIFHGSYYFLVCTPMESVYISVHLTGLPDLQEDSSGDNT
jgi:hypothetical protein